MVKVKVKIGEIASFAAILVTIASLLASICWISSSRAGGESDDMKTAALGFMILRLESATQASTSLVQAQSYLTQAGMYFAQADSADDKELQSYLNELGNQSLDISTYHASLADDAEQRSQAYYDNYSLALSSAKEKSTIADYRSTGALLFTMSAIVASSAGLFKRKEILYVYLPIFFVALSFLIISLV
jgi:hypothetical protein